MSRRKRQEIINRIMLVAGALLIIGVVWYARKEFLFKTYRNDEQHFTIKYPSTWSKSENVDGAAVIFKSPKENALDIFFENVTVVVQDRSGNPMTLKEYSEQAIYSMELVFGENFVIREAQPFILAGQDGFKLEFIGKSSQNDLHYLSTWTLNGTTAYQVTYTAIVSQYDKYLPKAKKIIRSFRILR